MQDDNEKNPKDLIPLDEKTAKREIQNWFEAIDFEGFEFSEEKELKKIEGADSEENDSEEFPDLDAEKPDKKTKKDDSPNMQESFYNILLKYAKSGVLIFGNDGMVVHKLIRPIYKPNGLVYLETLNYDCDVEYGKFKTKLNELDTDDNTMDSRLYALVSAVTGIGLGVLYKLKMRDAGISRAIALFIG